MAIILEPANPYTGLTGLVEQLPELERNARIARGLSVKQAAALIGIGADTLTNLEAGSNYTRSTLLAVLGWLSTTV